jgi:4-hydroxy-2-oxoglutarate aldolase
MEALDLQRRLTPLARVVSSTYGIGGLKAAMDIVGYVGGQPRKPLPQIPPKGIEQVRQELELLTDTEMLHSGGSSE